MEKYKQKEKPVCVIEGLSQGYIDEVLERENRFNFVPYTKPCAVCGNTDYAYSAFAMADGRQTVRRICTKCGKHEAMPKVRFKAKENEIKSCVALCEKIFEIIMSEQPAIRRPLEMATVSVESNVENGIRYIMLRYPRKNLMYARIIERKKDLLERYFSEAFERCFVCVEMEQQEEQDVTPSEEAKNAIHEACKAFCDGGDA